MCKFTNDFLFPVCENNSKFYSKLILQVVSETFLLLALIISRKGKRRLNKSWDAESSDVFSWWVYLLKWGAGREGGLPALQPRCPALHCLTWRQEAPPPPPPPAVLVICSRPKCLKQTVTLSLFRNPSLTMMEFIKEKLVLNFVLTS